MSALSSDKHPRLEPSRGAEEALDRDQVLMVVVRLLAGQDVQLLSYTRTGSVETKEERRVVSALKPHICLPADIVAAGDPDRVEAARTEAVIAAFSRIDTALVDYVWAANVDVRAVAAEWARKLDRAARALETAARAMDEVVGREAPQPLVDLIRRAFDPTMTRSEFHVVVEPDRTLKHMRDVASVASRLGTILQPRPGRQPLAARRRLIADLAAAWTDATGTAADVVLHVDPERESAFVRFCRTALALLPVDLIPEDSGDEALRSFGRTQKANSDAEG